MRNSRGIEVKKGYHAWGYSAELRRNTDGKITAIKPYGTEIYPAPLVVIDDDHFMFIEDITQVLPPMRIGRGGVVKANPVKLYGAAIRFADGLETYYTGRAGEGYMSIRPADAFFGYTEQAAISQANKIIKRLGLDKEPNYAEPFALAYGDNRRPNPAEIHIDIGSHNTKGRNVRAKNPVTEARELWLYARNLPQFVNAARDAFRNNASAADWRIIALLAARRYSEEFGNGVSRWRDIFTEDDLSVTASMLRDDMQNEAEDDAQYAGNPTPRLTRYDQPSQRERISERTGRATKTPSARLKNRRLKTHHFAPEGVWANPLTRVKLKSPAQRGGADPSPRLLKRRRVTAKAPAGFYANPVDTQPYKVVLLDSKKKVKLYLAAFSNKEDAVKYARAEAMKRGVTVGILSPD